MRDTVQEILTFWFQELQPHQWFTVDPGLDTQIKDRFLPVYEMACQGLDDEVGQTQAGALALCVLFDQFPRRMFRGTADAFATDDQALAVARYGVKRGFHHILPHAERFFLFLPYEHSERLEDQEQNLKNFKSMEAENPIAYMVARRRYEIFSRFGRFPERNAALGRENTEEEKSYILQINGFHMS